MQSSAVPKTTAISGWPIAALVLPLIIFVVRGVPVIADSSVPTDTQYTYLPLARSLLQDFEAFWQSTDALKTAPGAYVIMALAGADVTTLKTIYMAMAMAMVVLLFDCARRIAGNVAAAMAAWLCALSPGIVHLSIYPMVEPPFLFFETLWFWCSAYCISNHQSSWRITGAVLVGGLALTAATLTRATYMYWIPAAIFLLLAATRARLCGQGIAWQRLAWIHAIALVLIGCYMARNQAEFNKPAIAAGAGAALYFGSNPLLNGQEPPFFGLPHDEGTVTGHLGHLSLEGDARLHAVTRTILINTPVATLITMYVQKAGTWLFYSKSHLRSYFHRFWRVILVVLALAAIVLSPRAPAVLLIAGAALYQWVVHIPVLYNPRYSVSALDIQLMLLAAIGVAQIHRLAQRKIAITVCTATIVAGAILGAWHQRYSDPLLPVLDTVPSKTLEKAQAADLAFNGLEGNPLTQLATSPSGRFSIEWTPRHTSLDGTTLIQLRIPELQGACRRALIRYTALDGQWRESLVRLHGFDSGQDFTWGLHYQSSLGAGGHMQLSFECDAGTALRLTDLGLYEASLGRRYRAQALKTSF